MSGGSYNYLFSQDPEDLLGGEADRILAEMRDDLAKLGYADDAAMETAGLLLEIRASRVRIGAAAKRLSPVWKAMEWWKSCDRSEDAVHAALREYRGQPIGHTDPPGDAVAELQTYTLAAALNAARHALEHPFQNQDMLTRNLPPQAWVDAAVFATLLEAADWFHVPPVSGPVGIDLPVLQHLVETAEKSAS